MASIRKTKQPPFTVQELDAIVERATSCWWPEGKKPAIAGGGRDAAQAAAGAPAAMPPQGNTGGKSTDTAAGETRRATEEKVLLVDGKPKIIPARRGYGGDHAFIDWINFTCKQESFHDEYSESSGIHDTRIIDDISFACEKIFGFGITHQRESGANFYKRSFVLGDSWGMVCHGGQRQTVLVSVTGQGCAAAKPGWEQRLKDWLETYAINGRITRIDLAHDDYNGMVTVDDYSRLYDENGFNCGGRNPDCENRGNWKTPNGKGRSFYVGNRENGKFFRAYEKGMQLGDKTSSWVRAEVEFKSVDRDIPTEVLTHAGEYLAAAYPCLGWINTAQERIKTINKAVKITYEKSIEWLRTQVGAYLWSCAVFEGDGDETAGFPALMEKLMRVGVIPKRLSIPDFRFSPRAVHHESPALLLQ